MKTRLYKGDDLRFIADHEENNFVDIEYHDYEALAVDFYTSFNYIEVRKKEHMIRVLSWKSKRYKHESDLGWWEDAEVIYSCNEKRYDA